MADTDPAYVEGLATQLRSRRPDLLEQAEDELRLLRGRMQTIARFLHNPAIALDVRAGLAQDLHLPTPEK